MMQSGNSMLGFCCTPFEYRKQVLIVWVHLFLYPLCHSSPPAHILPTIWPRQLILVISDHQTFQSSTVYSKCHLVKFILALLWWCLIKDFFHFTITLMPVAELMMHYLRRDESVGNVLKCPSSLRSIINLPNSNYVSNIVNISHSKLGLMITRRPEKVKMMLRVNATNSNTTKACCIMYLSSRKTRVKQSNDIKGLGSSQFLHSDFVGDTIIAEYVGILYF